MIKCNSIWQRICAMNDCLSASLSWCSRTVFTGTILYWQQMEDWGLMTKLWCRGGGREQLPSPRPIILLLVLSLPSAASTKLCPWRLFTAYWACQLHRLFVCHLRVTGDQFCLTHMVGHLSYQKTFYDIRVLTNDWAFCQNEAVCFSLCATRLSSQKTLQLRLAQHFFSQLITDKIQMVITLL